MAWASIVTVITLLLQQYIEITQEVTCASNPCNLVAGLYDSSTGYCCYNVPPSYTDALCTCPNNIQPVVNAPCRTTTATIPTTTAIQTTCTKPCVNGGVCNIVNGQQVCWCQLGYTGENCEIQCVQNRCYTGLCQAGACYQQVIGSTAYAYCRCIPGYRGITCNQCYFTCPRQGTFPDTAYCTIGRYFVCSQAGRAPVSAVCPNGQRFNRLTNQCDSTYQCT